MTMRPAALALATGLLLGAGCTTSDDPPASFVIGLRVLAAVAEPPQVDPGGVSQVSLLVVQTSGLPFEVAWGRCDLAPRPGEAVNPECVKGAGPPVVVPIGAGDTVAAEMPAQVTAADLGMPDATGGVYLPLVAVTTDADDSVTTVYRLRLGDGGPPNMNPEIASVDVFDAAGVATPIDPAVPLAVHAGDKLTLGAIPAPGSAQTYVGLDGLPRTETLSISWYSTAGELSVQKTSDFQPQTVLDLAKNPLNAGKNIDLYAVVHDERGGVGYTHRVLEQQ